MLNIDIIMLNYFINHKSKTVNRAAGILTISAVISRFLGIIRDWLLANNFGAGSELDIYFTAFKVPDFIYNILILGGILVAFLPLFSEYFSKNRDDAWEFVSNCLNIFIVLSFTSSCSMLFSSAGSSVRLIKAMIDGFLIHNFM